jgi:endonuclease YncB( thermonuclease family)
MLQTRLKIEEGVLRASVVALCAIFLLPFAASAYSLTGAVVRVVDGDTIYVLDGNYEQHKIRLAGIDAPERKQAYGLASRKHLASIVAGQQVSIEYQKHDRYGRIVGKVLHDGIDVCLEQVKNGFAWHYKKYQQEQDAQDRQRYAIAENQARDSRLGLWRENNPNAPWEFRRLHRSQ